MENKLARFFRATGKLRFFLPLGIVLVVMGIMGLSMAPDEYGEARGTVTGIREYTEKDSQDREATFYEVAFTYNVDGKTYENTFDGYSEAPEIGSELPVYYDPSSPDVISNTKYTAQIALAMLAVGAAAIVFSVLSTVKAVRKQRELDARIREAAGTDGMPVITPLPKDQLTEYYVSFDGRTLRPGYIVEDKLRNVVYTAEMTKNTVVAGRRFTFTNARTGISEEHKVGLVVTESYSNEFFSVESYFKFDGVNIWDVLHERGIRISTDIRSAFPNCVYTVSLNGRFLATVEPSGRYVHEEDAAEHKVNIPSGRYYFRLWTNAADLELPFLTVFAISETEQTVVE